MTTQRNSPATPPAPPPPEVAEEVELDPFDDLPAPRNVIEALSRVTWQIGGIRKLTPAQRRQLSGVAGDDKGVTFAYRGIDQIASAAQPLFGRYGVVVVPKANPPEVIKIIKGSATMDTTTWTRTTIEVEWSIYGPGGVDDKIVAVTYGVADDNSDKSVNKAMTAAFKNVLLRVLCIGDPADDTDRLQNPHDYEPNQPPPDPTPPPPDDPIVVLFNRVKSYGGTPVADELIALTKEMPGVKLTESGLKRNDTFRERVVAILDAADAAAVAGAQDADAEAPQDSPGDDAAAALAPAEYEVGDR